jgi:C_GCAxxG_C_C family probable redox protein
MMLGELYFDVIGKMLEDEKLVKKIGRKAYENDKLSGCSQSVLQSLQEGLNIGDRESFKAATVLSGGVARHGETCGALIGGLMALGLVIGRGEMEDYESYDNAMDVAIRMRNRFKEALKSEFRFDRDLESTTCREIQERLYGRSFNLYKEKGKEAFLEAGGHSERGCLKTCEIGARIAAEQILEVLGKSPSGG